MGDVDELQQRRLKKCEDALRDLAAGAAAVQDAGDDWIDASWVEAVALAALGESRPPT